MTYMTVQISMRVKNFPYLENSTHAQQASWWLGRWSDLVPCVGTPVAKAFRPRPQAMIKI